MGQTPLKWVKTLKEQTSSRTTCIKALTVVRCVKDYPGLLIATHASVEESGDVVGGHRGLAALRHTRFSFKTSSMHCEGKKVALTCFCYRKGEDLALLVHC